MMRRRDREGGLPIVVNIYATRDGSSYVLYKLRYAGGPALPKNRYSNPWFLNPKRKYPCCSKQFPGRHIEGFVDEDVSAGS